MLIILSGVETIHKKFYARNILRHFIPDFEVKDGYTANFRSHPYAIMDPEGKVVYDGEGGVHDVLLDPVDGSKNEYGAEILAMVQDIYVEVLLDKVRDNHFQNIFVDIESDHGVRTDPGYEWEEKVGQFIQPHTYQDVINNYNNRRFPVHVITGSFSKTFIDKIRQDIGFENVKAYNLVRHPSAMYLIHEKPDSYYAVKFPVTPDTDDKKVYLSITNAASLARYNDIKTIKYEEILKQNYIEIEGKQIPLPEGYENYNDLITTWEKEHAELEIVEHSRLEQFNNFCSNVRAIASEEYGEEKASEFPENIFTLFGYVPLTRDQIVAPKE